MLPADRALRQSGGTAPGLGFARRSTCQSPEDRGVVPTRFENQINRISGTATNPRQTERVVPGVRFRFDARLRRFANDPDLLPLLFQGMALVELDALGGSGSRGYGKVRFEEVRVDGRPHADWRPADPFRMAA